MARCVEDGNFDPISANETFKLIDKNERKELTDHQFCFTQRVIGLCIATDQEMESQDQNSSPSEVKVLQ